MDMSPFCVESKTLEEAEAMYGHPFPWGLNIIDARQICEGDNWAERNRPA